MATDVISSQRNVEGGHNISECVALFVNEYLQNGQSFLVLICEM